MKEKINTQSTVPANEQIQQLNSLIDTMTNLQKSWLSGYLLGLAEEKSNTNNLNTIEENSLLQQASQQPPQKTSKQYNANNPFTTTIDTKQKITGRDSQQQVYHLELSIEDSGISYQPGDSVTLTINDHATEHFIASSQNEVDDEIHLTLLLDDTNPNGSINENDDVQLFINNNDFSLPNNEDPIIMIADNIGIAPFRAFLQELDSQERINKTWLLFESQMFTQDFLYQVEWQDYLKRGILNKMEVAFSSEIIEPKTLNKQLFLMEKELLDWINNGAHIYICGETAIRTQQINEQLLTLFEKHNITSEKLFKEQRYHLTSANFTY